jgi:ribosomal protein S18 acetylase RimI-like enzyme
LELVDLPIEDESVAAEVLDLQRRAYAVEAALVGDERIPPLHETLDELRRCGERFAGARIGGALAGVVSWKLDGTTLDIHRLAVAPEHFRRGVATALVRHALAAAPDAERTIVQTGAANEPARALYRREGFEEVGEREPLPGLRVTLFERRGRSDSRR